MAQACSGVLEKAQGRPCKCGHCWVDCVGRCDSQHWQELSVLAVGRAAAPGAMETHSGSTTLFSIFGLTIFSLVLFPYTVYHCCFSEGDASQTWADKGKKKKQPLSATLRRLCTKGNLTVLALWAAWFLLLWWVSSSVSDLKPFDPFEILLIERGATDKEIKKAYRQLSLKFHPDKNPDPKATKYFAEYITKAYQALTDEVSKQNYEKYGHPDGPQAMNVGVALPEWIFPQDKNAAPLVLIGLVGCGILLPLIVVSWYMLSSNKFAGPNRIMQETLAFYFHSKYSIKEQQSLVRIPETLVCAMEFIIMHTPSEQNAALDELRRLVLRSNPDLKDKPLFWKRKASVLKVHMLLLAYLEREPDIPALLQPDLKFVMQKSPLLLEEMLKIAAAIPRAPHGYGWLTPSVAVVEMMQCLSQAMSITVRKPPSNKPADVAAAALLQLPHFDGDVLKKLKRKKVTTLKELADLSAFDRSEALLASGLTPAQIEEVSTLMAALPSLQLRAVCEMPGEEEVMEGDMAKCKIRLMLTRPSHRSESYQPPTGKTVPACCPLFPHPKEEQWHFFLADPSTNSVLGWAKSCLLEAETYGFEHPEAAEEWASAGGPTAATGDAAGKAVVPGNGADAGKGEDGKPLPKALATAAKFIHRYNSKQLKGGANGAGDVAAAGEEAGPEDAGQLVEINFMAPKAGKYELQLIAMCDCYVGSDRTVPVRLKVSAMTRAAMDEREARNQKAKWESDDEEEAEEKGDKADGSEEEEEESEGDDYDSDETGELESGEDEDSENEGDDDDEVSSANDKKTK